MARKRIRRKKKGPERAAAQPKAAKLTRRDILKMIPPVLSVAASLSTLTTNGSPWLPGTQQPVTHQIRLGDRLNLADVVTIKPAVMPWTGQDLVIQEG